MLVQQVKNTFEQNETTGHFRSIRGYKRYAKERRRLEKEQPNPLFLSLSPETGLSYTPPPPKPKPEPIYTEDTRIAGYAGNGGFTNAHGERRLTYDVKFKRQMVSTLDHSDEMWGAITHFCKYCDGQFAWDICTCPVCYSPKSMLPIAELDQHKNSWIADSNQRFVCYGCFHTSIFWYPQCINCGKVLTIENRARIKTLENAANDHKSINDNDGVLIPCRTCNNPRNINKACPVCVATTPNVIPFNQIEPPPLPNQEPQTTKGDVI